MEHCVIQEILDISEEKESEVFLESVELMAYKACPATREKKAIMESQGENCFHFSFFLFIFLKTNIGDIGKI